MKKKLWLATALLLALLLLVCACNGGTTDGGTADGGTTDDGTTDSGTHTHTPGEWLVDQAPTCMKTGTRHRECTACGKTLSTETLAVVATAHNYASTWTSDGESHWHKCQNSGCTSVKDKAPHTYSSTYSADATYMYMACTEKDCTATTSKTAHNMIFSVSGGKATLTDYRGSAASVVIPTTYNGSPVTSIGDHAFYDCDSLTSITIPDSVTSIGVVAFGGCDSLSFITVDKNNTVYHSADNCLIETKSKTLVAGCKSSVIPSDGSVTSIGSHAFYYCKSLTSITIPNSVTSIGSDAFDWCDSLTYNKYGNAYYLGNADNPYLYLAKAKSKDVTSCTIHANTRFIGSYAFENCSKLTSIGIPSVTSIGSDAFYNCDSLTSITIPNSVTSIGSSAFSSCSNLTSITIPDSVTSIGDYAFSSCSSLTSITVDKNNTVYHSAGNCLIETKTKTLIAGCNNSVIPSDGSVTSIGDYAFYWCDSLTSITIPNSVTSIGAYAFSGCSGLTYNEYGNAYYLGNADNPYLYLAKAKSTGVTSCTVHEDTRFIGSHAFYYCKSLTSITIGNGVTSIGAYAFSSCSNLTSIHFNGTKAQWNAISKGSDWNYNTGAYKIYCTDGTLSK